MRFAFLLPAYKPQFLSMAIESILAQSYEDFEIIVLDDCSPYDLQSIVRIYKDSRIKYHRNKTNIGQKSLVKCWNKLLSLTDAEYIVLASDDDIYIPNFLESANELIRKYPDIDLIRGRVANINEKEEIINADESSQKEILCFDEFIEFLFLTKNIKCISNYIFRRDSLIQKNSFVDFPLAWYSDTATAMNLSYNSVGMINEVVFLFRLSGLNISCTINSEVAYKKCIATIQYNNWFKKNIISKCTSVEKNKIMLIHKSEIKKMLNWHIFYCEKNDFIKLLFYMVRNHISISNFILKSLYLYVIKIKHFLLTKH